MDKLERNIILGVIFGVAVYVVVAIYADIGAMGVALADYAWWTFAAAIALSTANYSLRFVKWQVFLRALDIRVPHGRSALIFTSGFVMSVTPGKMGEVFKSVLLRQTDGHSIAKTAPVVLAERITDLLALSILALSGVASYGYGTGALVGTLLATLASVLALRNARVAAFGFALLERLPLISRAVPKLREAYDSTHVLLAPGRMLSMTLLSVASWSLECVAFWLIVHGFAGFDSSIDLDLFGAVFVWSSTTVLGAISFMPGGLGVAEASLIGALKLLGMVGSETTASAAAILARLATLWWAVLVGFVAFGVFKFRRRKL